MTRFERCLLLLALIFSLGGLFEIRRNVTALEVTSSGTVPSGASILVSSGGCPGGYTEDTTARGRFLVGAPAAGTIGGIVGAAITNLSDTAGHLVASNCDGTLGCPTLSQSVHVSSAGANKFVANNNDGTGGPGTALSSTNSTTRSVVSPYIQILICKKS